MKRFCLCNENALKWDFVVDVIGSTFLGDLTAFFSNINNIINDINDISLRFHEIFNDKSQALTTLLTT